ncbi:MAG: hypothetical protein FWD61_09420 [Phycisphaerales bacterium]|nr:hypothetical protein [Phycisphaerales bacterium]
MAENKDNQNLTRLESYQTRIYVELSNGEMFLVAGLHRRDGFIVYTPIPFSTFSESLTCYSDLERIVAEVINAKSG